MYGYRFSGIVFTRCYCRFSCKVVFSCPSLHPSFVVMDLLLSSFLWRTTVAR
ncbi:tRNA (adenine-N6)-methyltransferase [Citrobacter sp. NCU1]|nr:tRNA (adenine-N6)-methyltransferase [Citrobacter sp. NCU1]